MVWLLPQRLAVPVLGPVRTVQRLEGVRHQVEDGLALVAPAA